MADVSIAGAMSDSTGSILYSVRDLVMHYGQRQVLSVDRLEVRRGEILALVGPSGAGKSTLLRCLNLLEMPDAGTVTFAGHVFGKSQTPPLDVRRRITTVFQRPVLLKRSVAANVAYGLHLRGARRVDDEVRAALAEVGLEELAHQHARTLSGGEAQRVALARAIILQPTALLLDEPTANLDPYNIDLIEGIVRRLNRERHTTTVLVTHNIFQAKRLAHRIALLLEGRIVEVAETATFFENPSDARTAAFVRGEIVY